MPWDVVHGGSMDLRWCKIHHRVEDCAPQEREKTAATGLAA
jgi:hypothetical protein